MDLRVSDGAAVMTGRSNGVAARLKKHSPRMISVNCVAHRLALAASHAADGIPYLQRFKSTLQTLFISTKTLLFAWLTYMLYKTFLTILISSVSRPKMYAGFQMILLSRL